MAKVNEVVSIIIIFSLFLFNPTSAEMQEGTLSGEYAIKSSYDASSSEYVGNYVPNALRFKAIQNMAGWQYTTLLVPEARFGGSERAEISSWTNSVNLSIGGIQVGRARMGYYEMSANYYVWISVQDDGSGQYYFDPMNYTGDTEIDITNSFGSYYTMLKRNIQATLPTDYDSSIGNRVSSDWDSYIDAHVTTYTYSWYETTYQFEQQGALKYFNYIRNNSTSAQLYITDEGSNVIINETSMGDPQKSNLTIFTPLYPGNNTWYMDVLTYEGISFNNIVLNFGSGIDATGTIYLDKHSYTDPENITIGYTLFNTDFTNNNYLIGLEYEISDGYWTLFQADFNKSTLLSSSSGSFLANPRSELYLLPQNIRVAISEYVGGVGTTIATSNEVVYKPTTPYDYTISGTVFDAYTVA